MARHLRSRRLYGDHQRFIAHVHHCAGDWGGDQNVRGAPLSRPTEREDPNSDGQTKMCVCRYTLLMALMMQACPASSTARCLPCHERSARVETAVWCAPTSLLPRQGYAHIFLVFARKSAMTTSAPAACSEAMNSLADSQVVQMSSTTRTFCPLMLASMLAFPMQEM